MNARHHVAKTFFLAAISAGVLSATAVTGVAAGPDPAPGEPSLFADDYSTAPKEEGTAYALVSHLPGPLGGNEIESFTSSRSAGYVAAVKAFTNPDFVRDLVGKLRQAGRGQMPRYYQVLLKVKFSAEEPTEITYVMARELRYPSK